MLLKPAVASVVTLPPRQPGAHANAGAVSGGSIVQGPWRMTPMGLPPLAKLRTNTAALPRHPVDAIAAGTGVMSADPSRSDP